MSRVQLAEIADRLRSWRGDVVAARELRERVKALGEVGGAGADPAERAVLIARNVLCGGKSADKEFGRSEVAAHLAAFLGAEPPGGASYHDPMTIDDPQARFWLDYLIAHPVVPDERMLRFAGEMFRVRPRQLWVPAADALVKMAGSSTEAERELLVLCEQFVAEPSRGSRPVERGLGGQALHDRAVHMHRHTRYAAARWLASGRDPQKLPPSLRDVPRVQAPSREATEFSIDVLCLAARLQSDRDRASFLPHVLRFIDVAPRGEVVDDAFRHLVQVLAALPAAGDERQALERYLLEPAWITACAPRVFVAVASERPVGKAAAAPPSKARISADAVLSWLESVEIVRLWRPEVADVLRDRYPAAATALDLRLRPSIISDPVEALVERLAIIFDADRYATTPPLDRALRLAETLDLFRHPDVEDLSWRRLLRRAAGAERAAVAHDGSVGEMAMADVMVWLGGSVAQAVFHRGGEAEFAGDDESGVDVPPDLPLFLLRQIVSSSPLLPERALLCLAAVGPGRGHVSIQAALHAERRLRGARLDPTAQIRLLWRVLEVDPPAKFLTELYAVLRGDDTSLHRVVEAIKRLDDERGSHAALAERACSAQEASSCTARVRRLLAAYRELATAAQQHIEGSPSSSPPFGLLAIEILHSLVAGFETLDAGLHGEPVSADPGLLEALGRIFRGEPPGHGLAAWMNWVDADATASETVSAAFRELEATLRPFFADPGEMTEADCSRVENVEARLSSALTGCPWPEREIVECAAAHLHDWVRERRRELESRGRFAAQVARALVEPDVSALAKFVDRAEAAFLPPATVRQVHSRLLEEGEIEAARGLRGLIETARRLPGRTRVALVSVLEHHVERQRVDEVLAEMQRLCGSGDEGENLDSAEIRTLPPEAQVRAHEFLLDRFHLRRAFQFRRAVGSAGASAARLRSEVSHFGPLCIGILVGTFFMVDFGNRWNVLLGPGRGAVFAVTVLASLAAAGSTLLLAALRRSAGDVGSAASRAALALRIMPVFGAAVVLAAVCATAVLASLQGSDAAALPQGVEPTLAVRCRQVVLWATLALFLGMVLGVIGQFRGVYGPAERKD